MEKSVCLLFQGTGPHPSHRNFGDAVDATYRHFETGCPPKDGENQDKHSELDRIRTGWSLSSHYDLVIAEGTAALQTLVSYKWLSNRMATTVFLAADETFFNIRDKPTRFLWHGLKPVTNTVDLCISISQLVNTWIKPFLPNVPCQVVHPTTTAEKYNKLSAIEASSPKDPFRLLSVGDVRKMKNYPTLVRAVESVNEGLSQDITLTILGEGHQQQPYASKSFISTPGRVSESDFATYFDRSSAYIQPSMGDGFGVAALEGMLAGLPTIVTELVGMKQLLDDRWVFDPTTNGLRTGIKNMIEIPQDDRIQLGLQNRHRSQSFSPESQAQSFRDAVTSI
jgi:glycosyltransferase involved in cell wall biosynthesis